MGSGKGQNKRVQVSKDINNVRRRKFSQKLREDYKIHFYPNNIDYDIFSHDRYEDGETSDYHSGDQIFEHISLENNSSDDFFNDIKEHLLFGIHHVNKYFTPEQKYLLFTELNNDNKLRELLSRESSFEAEWEADYYGDHFTGLTLIGEADGVIKKLLIRIGNSDNKKAMEEAFNILGLKNNNYKVRWVNVDKINKTKTVKPTGVQRIKMRSSAGKIKPGEVEFPACVITGASKGRYDIVYGEDDLASVIKYNSYDTSKKAVLVIEQLKNNT